MSPAISVIGVLSDHRPLSTPSSTTIATGSLTTLKSGMRASGFTRAIVPFPRRFATIPQRAGTPLTRALSRASRAVSGCSACGSGIGVAPTGGRWTPLGRVRFAGPNVRHIPKRRSQPGPRRAQLSASNATYSPPSPVPPRSVIAFATSHSRWGRWLPSRLIPHRHRPRAELQPAHEPQVDTLR